MPKRDRKLWLHMCKLVTNNVIKRKEKRAGRPRPLHCEICGDDARQICFDHCHQTGKFRGWLCQGCNSVLGQAKDNPELLRRLADYLEQHRG